MTAYSRDTQAARLIDKLRAMFNLNDPGWGRNAGNGASGDNQPQGGSGQGGGSGNAPEQGSGPPPIRPPHGNHPQEPRRPQQPRPGNQNNNPPDLEDMWRDLNDKVSGLFGNKGGGHRQPPGGAGRGGFKPPAIHGSMFAAGAAVLLMLWAASGIFIVQEGYQAVVTRFGQYERTVNAGMNYRWPWPIGRHESVQVTQIQSADIGSDRTIKETGLNHYAMLTEDENIVEVRFAVQYRLSDARAWLFETQDPRAAVITAAESAVREVVGKMRMDNVLAGERDQISPRVRVLMQAILDRYNVGVEVVAINMQQSGVRPPEQVRDAFDDVLRADQERERAKNEAEAYANNVIPRAVGEASRIKEEAAAYRERTIAMAKGDADRFQAVLAEYQKAPRVTRERMYLETMEEVYKQSSKVVVDTGSGNGSSLMYLPLDKLVEQSAAKAAPRASGSVTAAGGSAQAAQPSSGTPSSTSGAGGNTGSASGSSAPMRPTRDSR